jgi:hypothetical protein
MVTIKDKDTHASLFPFGSPYEPSDTSSSTRLDVPLATVAGQPSVAIRFVHTPKVVCNRNFQRAELRKHSAVGLWPSATLVPSSPGRQAQGRKLVRARHALHMPRRFHGWGL